MLKIRLIPCLDVKDGRVVKGVKFVDLRDAGDPVEAAKAYDAAGADELCFLDITASHEDRGTLLDVVQRTAEACFMPLTVGGGVRTVEDIRKLLLAGADKVSINTAAVNRAGFRARGGREVRRPMHRGRDRRQEGFDDRASATAGRSSPMAAAIRPASTPWPFAGKVAALGAGELLLTSMDRDGTKAGYDVALDALDRRRGTDPGDRLRRRRHASTTSSRACARATPARCWRPRSSISGSTRSRRPRRIWRRRASPCGSMREPLLTRTAAMPKGARSSRAPGQQARGRPGS